MPLRTYSNWNDRASNKEKQIEPFKHYYFICEGQNTEKWYFEEFINKKKFFGISSLVHIAYLEKTEECATWSNPKKLIELAKSVRKDGSISFDPKIDKMLLVFDTDIYESGDEAEYVGILTDAQKDNIVCVTNPSFELFLLLHFENSYEEIIKPNESRIVANGWEYDGAEKIRAVEKLFRDKSHLRPKRDPDISKLVVDVKIAIEQEKMLNNEPEKARGQLTSNIGKVIKMILDDDGI